MCMPPESELVISRSNSSYHLRISSDNMCYMPEFKIQGTCMFNFQIVLKMWKVL